MEREERTIHSEENKWEGVVDTEFLSFLDKTEEQLVPFGEDMYEVRRTFYNCAPLIYKEDKLSEVSSVNMSRKLDLLRSEGIIYFEEKPNSKEYARMLIADRNNLILSLSFLYAKESIAPQNPRFTNIEKISDACKKSEELWGEHPNATIFKQGVYVLRDPLVNKKFMEQEERKKQKIPVESPKFKMVTHYLLDEKLKELKEKYPQWFVGSDKYVLPKDLGISQKILKGMEFVKRFDSSDLTHFSLEEDYRSIFEIIRDMEYASNKMKDLEQQAKERYGDGRQIRPATLYDLYASRARFIRENT